MERLSNIYGIGPGHASALSDAGIESLELLAEHEDIEGLSQKTGIPQSHLAQWQANAKGAVRMSPVRTAVLGIFAVIAVAAISTIFLTLRSDNSARAEQAYAEALASYDAGEYAETASLLDRAIADGLTSSNIYNLRGIVFHDNSELQEAERYYNLAIDANRFNAYAFNNLANVLAATGRPEAAVQQYRRAIEFDPYEPLFHENLGVHYEDLKQFDEAAESYLQAVRLSGNNQLLVDAAVRLKAASAHAAAQLLYQRLSVLEPEVWNWQFQAGWSALQVPDNAAAGRQLLNDVLQNFPDEDRNKWVYLNLGISYSRDDLQQAQLLIDRALRIDPEFLPALQQSAYFQRAAGNYAGAINTLERIIASNPDYTNAYHDLYSIYIYDLHSDEKAAQVFSRLEEAASADDWGLLWMQYDQIDAGGSYDEKRRHLEKINKKYPDDIWVIIKTSEQMLLQGRATDDRQMIEEALKLIEDTSKSHPNRAAYMASLYFMKAWGHHAIPHTRNLEVAEQYYRKAIEEDSAYVEAMANLMDVYVAIGKFGEGLAVGQAALDINSSSVQVLTDLGFIQFYLNDFESALEHLNLAIAIAENDPIAFASRALVYIWLGDQLQAREDIETARRALINSGISEKGSQWEFVIRTEYNPLGKHQLVHLFEPEHKEALLDVLLATTYVRDGRGQAAIQHYRQARILVSDDATASRELALYALAQLNRHKGAVAKAGDLEATSELLNDWYGEAELLHPPVTENRPR